MVEKAFYSRSYSVAIIFSFEKFEKQPKNPGDCHTSVLTGSQ